MRETAWFEEARFGLFIHFGLYSILGGEWNGRRTPFLAEWIMNSLDIPRDEYRRLAEGFLPTELEARDVVSLAQRAGMRYVCLTAKHHDGFALWDSATSDYNSVKSACGRDFVREFAEATREAGLTFCLYYSQAQDWDEEDAYRAYCGKNPRCFRRYFETKCKPQLRELLTNYGPLGMIWFDTPMGMSEEEATELRCLVKELQPDCLISGRIGHGLGDYRTTGDNMLPAVRSDTLWELPATMNRSWGYKKDDENWRSSAEILEELYAVLSRGGNYLLNIGPDGRGVLPEGSRRILEELAAFYEKNAPSVQGTTAAPSYPYVQHFFHMTERPGRLYVFIYRDPGQKLELLNLKNPLRAVRRLATGEELPFFDGEDLEGHSYWCIEWKKKGDDDITLPCVLELEYEGEQIEVEPF